MGSASASGENRAQLAAEQAAGSPLLEDVNLSGARGILVNITAGLDMSIGEFEEVGETIREFAAENATVVVGTVIDPEMQDELRVTVVATGLGNQNFRREDKPLQVVETPEPVAPDYQQLDRPTVIRKRASGDEMAPAQKDDMEYFDIPAFLRRQAD
jgi:cell division protein FtsZ